MSILCIYYVYIILFVYRNYTRIYILIIISLLITRVSYFWKNESRFIIMKMASLINFVGSTNKNCFFLKNINKAWM